MVKAITKQKQKKEEEKPKSTLQIYSEAQVAVFELQRVLQALCGDTKYKYLTTRNVEYLKECLEDSYKKVNTYINSWKDM